MISCLFFKSDSAASLSWNIKAAQIKANLFCVNKIMLQTHCYFKHKNQAASFKKQNVFYLMASVRLKINTLDLIDLIIFLASEEQLFSMLK